MIDFWPTISRKPACGRAAKSRIYQAILNLQII